MTTRPDARTRRHPMTAFRKDEPTMFHMEYPGYFAEERQARFRAEAERERPGRFGRRRFRHRVGESIISFGRRIGGETASDVMTDALVDPQTTPAWQG